jgi:hypothetical protein
MECFVVLRVLDKVGCPAGNIAHPIQPFDLLQEEVKRN